MDRHSARCSKKSKIRSRATHEICCFEDKAEVYESFGITKPEFILDGKLAKQNKSQLDAVFGNSLVSDKSLLFVDSISDILVSVADNGVASRMIIKA